MVELNFDTASQVLTCAFSGRMDTAKSQESEETIHKELAGITGRDQKDGGGAAQLDTLKVVFDLGEVEYISSAFLRLCLAVNRRLKKDNFSVVNTNPFIKKVFKITALDGFLTVL